MNTQRKSFDWAEAIGAVVLSILLIALDTGIILLGWNVFGAREAFHAAPVNLTQAVIVAIAFDTLSHRSRQS